MVSSTLFFESGIMKISDYDPIHGRYQTRTLQLPSLPLFDHFEFSLFDAIDTTTNRKKRPTPHRTMSRFIECFDSASIAYSTTSTLRSSQSISSKSTKAPRRCYSNPNMSKKHSSKAPKRSLSNALQVFTGLLPKSKRRLQKTEDNSCRLSISSSSTTIRMAWQGTTWLDEMKTSDGTQRLTSFDQTRPWWTTTMPLTMT